MSSPKSSSLSASTAGMSDDPLKSLKVMSQGEKALVKQEDHATSTSTVYDREDKEDDLTASQLSRLRLGAINGGLYGDTSIPATLPAMPKLAGPTATQYSDWKTKALGYFQTNGLTEVVTLKPRESLQLAIDIDGGFRTRLQVKALWQRLHSKAIGAIRTATEQVLGSTLFEEMETEQTIVGKCDVYNLPVSSPTLWEDQFISGNANHLWNKIRVRLEQFTPHDLSRLVDKYMSLKYTPSQDPVVFRREFDNSVRDLKQAGLILPDKLHMSIWYRALPSEFAPLRQALGANLALTWDDIYKAMVAQYSVGTTKKSKQQKDDEKVLAAIEKSKKDKKKCYYCQKPGHTEKECITLKKEKRQAELAAKQESTSDSEAEEHAAAFVENDLLQELSSGSIDEAAAAATDRNNVDPMVHFIFDSAATTHLTPVKRLVHNIQSIPESLMATAIAGHKAIINKRGLVRLNEKWTLRDVAFLPNASSSLISEGRLVDAGYNIYKNKDFILVRNTKGKVVLRGPRVNRLWIYTVNGSGPAPKPSNTIIPTSSLPQSVPHSENSDDEKKEDPNPPTRQKIPKRGTQATNSKEVPKATAGTSTTSRPAQSS
jgi:hypothetical protein